MGKRLLVFALLVSVGVLLGERQGAAEAAPPNLLVITVDDMSCDSVGAFGCPLPDTTPNIDALARQGMRFWYAHVVVGNCVPSRNVMQTGRYPHNSGVEGFYQVKVDFPILPDLLRQRGYFLAILGKVSHSTPYHPYPWDLVLDPAGPRSRQEARKASVVYELTKQAIAASQSAGKPFYLLMNLTDPHFPLYGMNTQGRPFDDPNRPSRVFKPEEVPVPGFLPDDPAVRKELAAYYSSVRRADDCVGAILRALKESGRERDTVVMFLSDHGMPFPFAKTNVYHHSTRTPWIVRWPGVVRPNTVDRQHMISAVDFMPTILDIVGIPHPEGLDGRSFLPLLKGQPQEGRDMVFKEYNENAGGARHPMRSVETKRFGYIFNPWSNGQRVFRTATQGTWTYRRMRELAETDPYWAKRLDFFLHRTREEFYDYQKDPDALHNLIDDPAYQDEVNRLRKALEDWMVRTGDHALEAFRHRNEDDVVEAYMGKVERESAERRKNPWYRRGGKRRTARRTNVIRLVPPRAVQLGQPVVVEVEYKLPDGVGSQKLHVTLKDGNGRKRLERKVVTIQGSGRVAVRFHLPSDFQGRRVTFAAFVGEDFAHRLQHVLSKPVPVRANTAAGGSKQSAP